MPRIRSVHPGLFTDEAFMSASLPARLLMIGVWTEAMDDGVFEWKPIVLKARLFPADACDVEALLNELVALNVLKRIEHKGRNYGVLRNFRRYQRPKKPHDSGILSEPDRAYVGLVPNQRGTEPEIPPQMEDEGEGCRGKGSSSSLRSEEEKKISDAKFDRFWSAYPAKENSTTADAKTEFDRLSDGEQDAAIAACPRYAEYLRKNPAISKQIAVNFLAKRRFEGFDGGKVVALKFFAPDGSAQLAEWNRAAGKPYPANATGPDGHTKGWYFDSEWPPGREPRGAAA